MADNITLIKNVLHSTKCSSLFFKWIHDKKMLKILTKRCFFFNAALLLLSVIFQVSAEKMNIFFFVSLMVELNRWTEMRPRVTSPPQG